MKHDIIPGGDIVALAVARSLGRENIKTIVLSEKNNHPIQFYSRYCHYPIVSEDSIKFFSRFSKNDLVMPIMEDQIKDFAKNKNKFPCTLAFPEYRVLDMASSKNQVMKRAMELNIPCPKTLFSEDIDPCFNIDDGLTDQIKYPIVIKPHNGSGGKGVTFVNSRDQLEKIYNETIKKFGPVLIQEKIPNNERYAVGILMNFDHEIKRSCVLKEIRNYPVETGPATLVETIKRPDLVSHAQNILESMDFYGIAELDFVNDSRDNSPKLMEINPRFWGSLQGAISAGVDFPFLLHKLFEDGDINKKTDYKLGIRTRNVIFNDFRRLYSIINGNYPMTLKISSVIEFLKFYKDDAYFIFDREDIKPFFSIFMSPLQRKLDERLIRDNEAESINKSE
jgi:predicted ATP-grasp superfamily ATP-dependent carboligase